MASNREPVARANRLKSACSIVMRSFHGQAQQFSRACCAASASISIPVMAVWRVRWAAIMARIPVPVPISRMLPSCGSVAHAPNNTLSVPTFMAQCSCRIENCRKWNIFADIIWQFVGVTCKNTYKKRGAEIFCDFRKFGILLVG